jgi:hypothetical protein
MYKSLAIVNKQKRHDEVSIPSDNIARRITIVKVANRRGREIPSYNTAHRHS